MPNLNGQTCIDIFICMQSVPHGVFCMIHYIRSPIKDDFFHGGIYINVVWTNAKVIRSFQLTQNTAEVIPMFRS